MVQVISQKLIEFVVTLSVEEARAVVYALSHASRSDPSDPVYHALFDALNEAGVW